MQAYRVEVLDRIVSLTERNSEKLRAPKMGRLTKILSLGKSILRKHKDECTSDWLSRLLRDYGSSNDIGGKERGLTARRLLRKNFPEYASKLDPLVRHEDFEWTYLLRAYQRHDWVLRECLF